MVGLMVSNIQMCVSSQRGADHAGCTLLVPVLWLWEVCEVIHECQLMMMTMMFVAHGHQGRKEEVACMHDGRMHE